MHSNFSRQIDQNKRMAQKRIVVVMSSQNSSMDNDQVSQVLDETAQSLQKLAKTLAESSQSQPANKVEPYNLRNRKKKEPPSVAPNAGALDEEEVPPKKRGRKVIKEATKPTVHAVLEPEESTSASTSTSTGEKLLGKEEETEDSCPICYEKPLHPVTLPNCRHVYCFLCGKGLVESGASQCAMCRSVIPRDFFKHPNTSAEVSGVEESDFFWYYQGSNGWWRFDARNNADLENSFQDKQEKVHFLICGHLYVIDFKKMVRVKNFRESLFTF